jgi:nucleoside-diphosphate-sugar epimerase
MSRRTVVTGGAGFVGSHVADAFLDSGYDVLALDDLSTGHERNLPRRPTSSGSTSWTTSGSRASSRASGRSCATSQPSPA